MASKCASASRPLLRQSCPRVALRKLNLPVTHRKLSHLRVTCLRRIRGFFFAAASVACPLRKIRRLSPRIRRLSASPKNRDCPTRSHRRIRCYHPFPVAAASVAKPRHPIRPNPPPAPSAACPRSRVRRGSPPPDPPTTTLATAASGRLTCPPPSLFACYAVSCKSVACPHRFSSASRLARSPPVPPAASVACPRRLSSVSLPYHVAAPRRRIEPRYLCCNMQPKRAAVSSCRIMPPQRLTRRRIELPYHTAATLPPFRASVSLLYHAAASRRRIEQRYRCRIMPPQRRDPPPYQAAVSCRSNAPPYRASVSLL